MVSPNLKFSVNQVVVANGKRPFDDSDFIGQANSSEPIKIGKEVVGILQTEVTVLEGRFFCIHFKSGEKYPYSSTVFDTASMQEDDNPRPLDDIELRENHFVLIDQHTQKIYLSDLKQRAHTSDWLKRNLKDRPEILIKPIFAEREFIDRIKTVNKISMTVVPNLLNSVGGTTLSQALREDALGYDAEEATLILKYKKKVMKEIKEQAHALWDNRAQFKDITIEGKDVDGLEAVYNTTEVVSKIAITPPQDPTTKQFVPSETFLALAEEIKKLK